MAKSLEAVGLKGISVKGDTILHIELSLEFFLRHLLMTSKLIELISHFILKKESSKTKE